jgi:phosphoribosyl 1,2-cyclic phosphate phosphodiesterase
MKITFLGTAANGGVPQLDCMCPNCTSGTIRKRSSLIIQQENENLFLDCGPDFKQQMELMKLKLHDLSGVAVTHLHWDHCHGLMELAGGKQQSVPVIVHKKLQTDLSNHQNFGYLFKAGFAQFEQKLKHLHVEFVEVAHDPNFPTFAIKVSDGKNSVVYVPDVARFNDELINMIKTSTLTVFDSTFLEEDKYNHMAIKNSAPVLKEHAKRVIYSHINHSESPEDIRAFVEPFGFSLAYDSLTLEI